MTNDVELVLVLLLVVDALALTVLVLLQQGKGADVGAAFGSGSSNTMFGGGGSATFLTKVTTWLTVGFFAISFALAYLAKERAATVNDLGIPQVENVAPLDGAAELLDDAIEEAGDTLDEIPDLPDSELTPADDGVDSDVPDV